jgi:hypothetical protein
MPPFLAGAAACSRREPSIPSIQVLARRHGISGDMFALFNLD